METTTTTKAKRTAGEWEIRGDDTICGPSGNIIAETCGWGMEANARTIALAGTAANAVDAMGLDGDAAIAALPEILREYIALVEHVVDLRNAFHVRTETDETMLRLARKTVDDAERRVARLRPAT